MDIVREIELMLIELWNKLYVFLCDYFEVEVNEDWFVQDDETVLS